MKITSLGALVLSALLFGMGCFNKDNPVGDEEVAPNIPQLIIFRGPDSPNAPQELGTSLGLLNGKTATAFNYLSLANLLSPEADENKFSWEVTYGQFNALIEARKIANGTVDWTLTLNGSDGTVTYNNWVAMRGNSDMDGASGTWRFFAENSATEMAQFTWEIDDNEQRFGTLILNDVGRLYDVMNHPNKSGSLEVKENGVKVYQATWDASGAGSWTAWDTQGNMLDSGSWN
ncbi:MAG: hypothetical protein V3U73_08025 [bacterium]